MDKKTRDAFRIVFEELTRNPIFKGKYDAKNGNEHFMYGVFTVMENIAQNTIDRVKLARTNQSIKELLLIWTLQRIMT